MGKYFTVYSRFRYVCQMVLKSKLNLSANEIVLPYISIGDPLHRYIVALGIPATKFFNLPS
jgi:hypothetical protein